MSNIGITGGLFEEAVQKARQLQQALSDLKAANKASRWFLEVAYKPAPGSNQAGARMRCHGYNIWFERADNACALAEEVKDPSTKRLLLEMAKSYDELAAAGI
jgi:hypothetical protein